MEMSPAWISVRGARVHNLKNIDVDIPRERLVVITGLSGSGKSSLAFDTIYAEGQRRYVESLSAYARQFLEQMEKPDVDFIDGLSPAISIEQKTTGSNPRSTVGTVTEIYDYLRLLFANVGVPHCHLCERVIASQSIDRIVDLVMGEPSTERVNVMAPIVRRRKGEFKKELASLRIRGFTKVRIDGQVRSLEENILLDRRRNHSIEVVVDRLLMKPGAKRRLTDAIDIALRLANDVVIVNTSDRDDRLFSSRLACAECGVSIPEITARVFSFNSPTGACPRCQGMGSIHDFDPERIIPDSSKTLREGAIFSWAKGDRKLVRVALNTLSRNFGFSLDTPFKRLPKSVRDLLLFGPGLLSEKSSSSSKKKSRGGRRIDRDPYGRGFEGIIPNLRQRYAHGTRTERESLEAYRTLRQCKTCEGERLCPESRAVRFKDRTISEYVRLSIHEALEVFTAVTLTEREHLIADRILREIIARLRFLEDVGVGYLALDRRAATLSGGEGQRVRLATQIGSSLTGVLYVLDEPSIGLHPRDNRLLLATLTRLRDLGNTVMVVEHDEDTIRASDYVVDLGPGAGEHGGHVIFQGTPEELVRHGKESLTAQFLSGQRMIETPAERRTSLKGQLVIRGARANNLKRIDATIPLGLLTVVTGVSGSGKSTLVNDILYKALAKILYRAAAEPSEHSGIDGIELVDKVVQIDQAPLGRTPRSNPATYTGIFAFIRELFSMLPESRARGYRPARFSFNIKGGRCETCRGDGLVVIEMYFMPNVFVTCEHCRGRRYNRETLEIKYRGKSIAEILALTVDQALQILENSPPIAKKLLTLQDVGLGYIQLGQSATTLSGGEAQRVKLAKELSRRGTGRALYILDEPTTGLHFEDTRKLLQVLNKLVDQGNSVVVIEHNLDIIKCADHVIDLGPEGGDSGGSIVAEGSPEYVATQGASFTGMYLKAILGQFKGRCISHASPVG